MNVNRFDSLSKAIARRSRLNALASGTAGPATGLTRTRLAQEATPEAWMPPAEPEREAPVMKRFRHETATAGRSANADRDRFEEAFAPTSRKGTEHRRMCG
jgi:hypothetical protein